MKSSNSNIWMKRKVCKIDGLIENLLQVKY